MDRFGDVRVVSGVGDKGTSRMQLSGGKGLGPDGARRLAELLLEAPPPLLASLQLRHASPPRIALLFPRLCREKFDHVI